MTASRQPGTEKLAGRSNRLLWPGAALIVVGVATLIWAAWVTVQMRQGVLQNEDLAPGERKAAIQTLITTMAVVGLAGLAQIAGGASLLVGRQRWLAVIACVLGFCPTGVIFLGIPVAVWVLFALHRSRPPRSEGGLTHGVDPPGSVG